MATGRRPFFCGNWKLNGSIAESLTLATDVRNGVATLRDVDVAVAPSFTALYAVAKRLEDGPVAVAAQDCFWEDKGAFTGEVSPAQLADAGCKYVILGHSERRQLFGELDAAVNLKARAALRAGLAPIICVGETLAERDAGETLGRVAGAARRGAGRHRPRPTWSASSSPTSRSGRSAPAATRPPRRRRRCITSFARASPRARRRSRARHAHPVRRQHEAGQRPRADGRGGRRRRPGGRRLAVRGIVRSSRARGRQSDPRHEYVPHRSSTSSSVVFLILVVLLQAGKGGGMGIAFGGGGGSQTVFGSSGAGNFLTRLTSITAVIFMVTSLVLAHYSSQQDSKRLQRLAEKKADRARRPRTSALDKLKTELEKAAGDEGRAARRRRRPPAARPARPRPRRRLPLTHPPLKLTAPS